MLSHSQATATPDGAAHFLGTTSTLGGTTNQPKTAAKKKKKKKKTPLATATLGRAEARTSADHLTAAKAAVVAAEKAAQKAAEAAAEAAVKASNAATAARASGQAAAEAAVKADNAATAARAAAEAAAESVKAVMAVEAAEETESAATTAAAEEATEASDGYWEYEESEEERAQKTFLYVPVEGDIQVRQRASATTKELLQWPYTEGHVLTNRKLAREPYILTGFIRSFDFNGPINKRYSKIYGNGTAVIRGPAMICNEDGVRTVSLTEKDIPRIFR